MSHIPRGLQAERNGGAKQPSAVFHGGVAWAASQIDERLDVIHHHE